MTRDATAAAAALLLLIAAAGCSGGDSDQPPAAASSPAASTATASPTRPAGGGRFQTPEAMKTALDVGGIRCAGLRDPQTPSDDGALRKVCTSGDGDDVVLAIYPTYAALQSEVSAVAEATWMSTPKSILAGENWTILGPVVYVEDVQNVLGGSITTSPS